MSFKIYVDRVEKILQETYHLNLWDADIELNDLAFSQEAGWSPRKYVKWFGKKYNLNEL
jgi:hypothetical protein